MDKRTLPKQQNEIRRLEARMLKEEGLSYREIAAKYGVSRQRVQQLVQLTPKERQFLTKDYCENCGSRDKKLNLHHEKYFPLVAKTLCTSCHIHGHSVARDFETVGVISEGRISDDAIVDFVRDFAETNQYPPAMRDFLSVGFKSSSHARYRVKRLVAAGRLGYTPGIARSIYVPDEKRGAGKEA